MHTDSFNKLNDADLFLSKQVASFDAGLINSGLFSGIELMSRAARACFGMITEKWPDIKRMRVFCGGGNNGGDGFLIAAMAAESGWQVQLIASEEHS